MFIIYSCPVSSTCQLGMATARDTILALIKQKLAAYFVYEPFCKLFWQVRHLQIIVLKYYILYFP